MARQEYLPHCHRPILSAHGSGITARWYADNNHNIKALQINVHLAFNVGCRDASELKHLRLLLNPPESHLTHRTPTIVAVPALKDAQPT